MISGNARSFCSTSILSNSKVSYSKTLNLPKSSFGPKTPSKDETNRLIKHSSEDLYLWQKSRSNYSRKFTLHDGPPYANGDLHLGHAVNKILKDLVNRSELIINNSKINYQPGWDCHGLPIELKALINSSNIPNLSVPQLRSLCRELAESMIDKQRRQFGAFAIMTNFQDPYVTMTKFYETQQLKIFEKLMQNGLLSRQLKPIWWGCETKTALAEAELEYNDMHKSIAIFVKFPVASNNLTEKLNQLFPESQLTLDNLKLLIWTSTPWTIPANKAISVNRDMNYTLIYHKETMEHLVIAEDLTDSVLVLDKSYRRCKSSATFKGNLLIGNHYFNPVIGKENIFPILHGPHVLSHTGSGLVHTAPAHGLDDYFLGLKHGLDIASTVDDDGCLIKDGIAPGFQHLAGKKVTHRSLSKECVSTMQDYNMIFHVNEKFVHSYPYDWRSKTPVIQRSTEQWFINIEKIQDPAIRALDSVKFFPQTGKTRLVSFVKNRKEWCISRQRSWGVPLPIVYDKESGKPLTEASVINYIVARLEELGTDEWFCEEDNISRWLPENFKDNGYTYVKGKDTMDVWFDSGTSWTSLDSKWLEKVENGETLADIYLEGSDQHRGWFQSSLLNSVIASGKNGSNFKPVAPYKEIITHGFTLDKNNSKMSKSKGNVISAEHVISGSSKPFIPALGTDGLRLWVASSNYNSDIAVSSEILSRIFENIKKLRVTFKYLLGNLYDFKTEISYNKLSRLDRYSLSKLYKLQSSCIDHFRNHNFSRVVKDINTHMSSELSASYFDISKDSLYTDAKDSHKRRSIQTVLKHILKTYIGLLAPIVPVMVQEVWNEYMKLFSINEDSPFKLGLWSNFYELPKKYNDDEIENDFKLLWELKDIIFKNLENLKEEEGLKNRLELVIHLNAPNSKIGVILREHKDYLCDYFLVSAVTVGKSEIPISSKSRQFNASVGGEELTGEISPSPNSKCPRCWKHVAPAPDIPCSKCSSVIC